MANTDLRLLGLLQSAFPLTGEPYADLGLKLGISADEVIRRVRELKARGIVRQIGPVLDARKLGYQSTLVAIKVPAEKLERAERLIREHPGVSHGYEREHDFNVWITLSVLQEVDIQAELDKLALVVSATTAFALPAVKVYKLRAFFGGDGEAPEGQNGMERDLSQRVKLSRVDRLIINELQQDLPLVATPFAPLASRLDMSLTEFLSGCQSLLRRGVIRRFGAAVSHRQVGYSANAMACWAAPPDMVDAAGQKLASLREVSHCYERRTNPLWRHNLFAMIHGHAEADCRAVVEQISRETGLDDFVILFSTREFKKVRIKYVA